MQEYSPYREITAAERSHLMNLLANDILPLAIDFKDDRVTNVRLTLRRTLRLMPKDISKDSALQEAARSLEEEIETWESFHGLQPPPTSAVPIPAPVPPPKANVNSPENGANAESKSNEDEPDRKVNRRKSNKKGKKKGNGENSPSNGKGNTSNMASI